MFQNKLKIKFVLELSFVQYHKVEGFSFQELQVSELNLHQFRRCDENTIRDSKKLISYFLKATTTVFLKVVKMVSYSFQMKDGVLRNILLFISSKSIERFANGALFHARKLMIFVGSSITQYPAKYSTNWLEITASSNDHLMKLFFMQSDHVQNKMYLRYL